MNEQSAYNIGLLVIVLGLTAVYLYPTSSLIPLAIMFIGVLALIAVLKGIVLILAGGGVESLMIGTMFLVILALLFDGLPLIVTAVKVITAGIAVVLQIVASFLAALI